MDKKKFLYLPTAVDYGEAPPPEMPDPSLRPAAPEEVLPPVDLTVELAGMTMKNPVVVASGTFGFGREYSQFFDLSELGGICAKGLTLLPREGNPAPRIAETPMGILNSVGLRCV